MNGKGKENEFGTLTADYKRDEQLMDAHELDA